MGTVVVMVELAIPEHFKNWAWATGREVFKHEGVWAYNKGERLTKDEWGIPDLESPEWRADVMDGLLAKGWTLIACRGKVNTRGNYSRKSGYSAFLSFGPLSDRTDIAGYGQSLNSALNAAVTKAREMRREKD